MTAHKPCRTSSRSLWRHGKGLSGAGDISHSGVLGWRSALWCSFLLWSLPALQQWSFSACGFTPFSMIFSMTLCGCTGAWMSRTLESVFISTLQKQTAKGSVLLLPPAFLKPMIEILWFNRQLHKNGKTVLNALQKHLPLWDMFLALGAASKSPGRWWALNNTFSPACTDSQIVQR